MKQHSIFQYLYILYASVFAVNIANIFIESETLNYIIGCFAILLLAISFLGASKLFVILSASFLVIGALLYSSTGESVLAIPGILTSNMALLTLLAMLPWMNSVVRSGRFDRSLNTLMKVNVSDLGKLYIRSSITTLTLTSFLNLSAASISQDVLKTNLANEDKKLRDSFISSSTLRGYSIALLWSPLEILLAMSIFLTGVSYVSVLPWLLLIAVYSIWNRFDCGGAFVIVSMLIIVRKMLSEQSVKVNVEGLAGKIIHLASALVIFLALVIGLGTLFDIDFILTVTLLIFPFTLVWSFIMKRSRSFWTIGWNNWKVKTNTMQNFIILFISLSFFSYSISNASFLEVIQKPILYVAEYPITRLFRYSINLYRSEYVWRSSTRNVRDIRKSDCLIIRSI